jgi:Tfp pilus assembly protein PilN
VRPVNLIPPEERRGEHAPLRTGALSYAIVGALGLALAGVVALVLTGNTISEKQGELADLEARQTAAEQRAQELAPYGEFASMATARRDTVSSLATSRFAWERVLRELALVIGDDVWLDSVTGAIAPGVSTGSEGGEVTTDPSITGPSLRIKGCATGQVAVAGFVAALKDIDGVTRVGMHQSALPDSSSGGAAAAAPATDGGATGDCQTRDFIAAFEISIAFDEVPVPAQAAAASATAPAVAPAEGAAPTTEQEQASDSAETQVSEASESAANVGVGE